MWPRKKSPNTMALGIKVTSEVHAHFYVLASSFAQRWPYRDDLPVLNFAMYPSLWVVTKLNT